MSSTPFTTHSRRAFLQRTGQMALAGVAAPLGLNLAALGEAAAFGATDYKALVCVFLFGGNDHMNTVVPYDDANHARYLAVRGGGSAGATSVALAKPALTATRLVPGQAWAGGLEYALAPTMPGLSNLFNTGRAAVLLNVGPLVVPLTRAQYEAGQPRPPQLFSHNDQQSVWQSSGAEGASVGWAGRVGDIVQSGNGEALFTCISLAGNAVLLSGRSAIQYQCTPTGAVPVYPVQTQDDRFSWPADQIAAFTQLITQPSPHLLENEYTRVMSRALPLYRRVSDGLGGVSLSTPFPANNSLAEQLKGVARFIAARSALATKRQVFMVSLGGFDVHDNLDGQQPNLLEKVSAALTAFYNATVELGVADKVTAFTASDFGRTFVINGNGSDHGWGGHYFVVGGAVKGAGFYGTPPPLGVGNTAAPEDQWHIGQGRLLPTTSVDQYTATLAKWFGVSDTDLRDVLPNLRNFGSTVGAIPYPVDLGFMRQG